MQAKNQIPSPGTHLRHHSRQSKPTTPYDQIPIALRTHHAKPFSQILQNTDYCLARKEKVREITRQTLAKDFKRTHDLQQAKEQKLLKSFKVRCKRKEDPHIVESNEDFFMGILKNRREELFKLNGEYLAMLKQELKQGQKSQLEEQGLSKEQKQICEYNIVFGYRSQHLSNPLKPPHSH